MLAVLDILDASINTTVLQNKLSQKPRRLN
jgi:hypothetical protein